MNRCAFVRLNLCCTTWISSLLLAAAGAAQTPPSIPPDKAVQTHQQSGVQYSILLPGTGKAIPMVGDGAVLRFHEWLADGTLLDGTGPSQRKLPIKIQVGDPKVPFGLNLAAQLISAGGKVKLTVPPKQAYGAQGIAGRIPPNATIIYEVELVEYEYRPKQPKYTKGNPAKTVVTESGIKYEVLKAGAGESPTAGDIVELEYAIWSVTGEARGGTYQVGKTVRAPLRGLAHPFLREVLLLMNKGSVWRCFVPTAMTVEQIEEDSIWQITLVDSESSETLPASNEKQSTTTKSGLFYETLVPGQGDRPRSGYNCELEWSFWKKEDSSFVAGSALQRNIIITLDEKAPHKFFPEILQLMRVGQAMRIEVPSNMTPPRMIPFDTVWKIKLVNMKAPLPAPKFYMPKAEELSKTPSGLQYRVVKRAGKGPSPRAGQRVTVHYAGWLTDGKQFDSSYSRNQPATFDIGKVIPGWTEALQLMKAGDTFLLVIPGKLAYGARGAPGIPPDATLVFHVELLKIGP
jgi:FKBP-type peptidyl-prolyl cis-trans isomerase